MSVDRLEGVPPFPFRIAIIDENGGSAMTCNMRGDLLRHLLPSGRCFNDGSVAIEGKSGSGKQNVPLLLVYKLPDWQCVEELICYQEKRDVGQVPESLGENSVRDSLCLNTAKDGTGFYQVNFAFKAGTAQHA